MSSILDIGTRSLAASQYALAITSKNIANANNSSYSRLEIQFSEAVGGTIGNGVSVSSVLRVFDEIANKTLQKTTSDFTKASTFSQNMSTIEFLFDGKNNGMDALMNESLNALNNINSNPSSTSARTLYLNQITNLTVRVNGLDSQLEAEQQHINTALRADVVKTNQTLEQLAQLNIQILSTSEENRPDLLDAREALLGTLSTYLGIESTTDSSGLLSISLSNGIPLLTGNTAYTLTASPAIGDPTHLDIAIALNKTSVTITNLLTRGDMGGQLSYQNNALVESRNALGRLALVMAQTMNVQNALGVDLQGNLGGPIFRDINTLDATTNRITAYSSNQGTADLSVNITDVTELTTSDYQLVFNTPTHYQLTRHSDHSVVSSGDLSSFPEEISVDGFSLNIASGTFVTGDTYTLSPTKNGARDMSITMTDANKLALGFPVVAASVTGNTGNGQLALTAIKDTSNAAFSIPKQLNPPLQIEFITPTMYQVINAIDKSVIETGLVYDPTTGADIFPTPGGFDPGFSVHLSGNNLAGDAFTLNYNSNGTGDNRNGLLMTNLFKKGTIDQGALNFGQAYRSINSKIASTVNTATALLESSDTMKKQAEFKRNQISAVSLQEETVNLTRFQQSYQASAQIIEAGQKIFDTLMSITRR